jgi:hypothetical protein
MDEYPTIRELTGGIRKRGSGPSPALPSVASRMDSMHPGFLRVIFCQVVGCHLESVCDEQLRRGSSLATGFIPWSADTEALRDLL